MTQSITTSFFLDSAQLAENGIFKILSPTALNIEKLPFMATLTKPSKKYDHFTPVYS